VIGDATVMEEFLRDKVVVYIHSCEYWLANTDPKLSEVQYVMQHFVHTETSVYAVPKSTILIKLAKPTEFLPAVCEAHRPRQMARCRLYLHLVRRTQVFRRMRRSGKDGARLTRCA
jgi:hypothetical protein